MAPFDTPHTTYCQSAIVIALSCVVFEVFNIVTFKFGLQVSGD